MPPYVRATPRNINWVLILLFMWASGENHSLVNPSGGKAHHKMRSAIYIYIYIYITGDSCFGALVLFNYPQMNTIKHNMKVT